MSEEIKEYYDQLASEYDSNRFDNSYGKYVDYQEKRIVRKLLQGYDIDKTLDMACGTGRFLDYATYGIDYSPQMLEVAQSKYPEKKLSERSILNSGFDDNTFSTILSFHAVMHLTKEETHAFLNEAYRITDVGGQLIFDFPSKDRRKLTNYKSDNWHASNDISINELKEMAKGWKLKSYYGILFFPIHRLPNSVRNIFRSVDNWFCRSFLRKYASYIIVVLEKERC